MFEWGLTLGAMHASLTQSTPLFDIWPMCAVRSQNYQVVKWLHEHGLCVEPSVLLIKRYKTVRLLHAWMMFGFGLT